MIKNLTQRIQRGLMLLDDPPNCSMTPLTPITGMSSDKTKGLPYILTSLGCKSYLEVGTFQGSTFIPAMMGAEDVVGIAVDNWSYPGSSLNVFKQNLNQFVPAWEARVQIISGDWRTVEIAPTCPVDFYLYDGDHAFEAHRDALKVVSPVLASEFIYAVDDYNNQEVRRGVAESLKGFEVVTSLDLGDGVHRDSGNGDTRGWWNGYFLAHLKKVS